MNYDNLVLINLNPIMLKKIEEEKKNKRFKNFRIGLPQIIT